MNNVDDIGQLEYRFDASKKCLEEAKSIMQEVIRRDPIEVFKNMSESMRRSLDIADDLPAAEKVARFLQLVESKESKLYNFVSVN